MKDLLVALAASTCFGVGGLGAPDLAPPGMRLVQNQVTVDWPDTLGAVRFVVAPDHGPQRAREVVRGAAFPVPRGPFANARLWAVPAGASTLPQDDAAWAASGWPSAPLPVQSVHSVSVTSAVHRIVTDLHVEAIDGTTLVCRVVRTMRLDRDGEPVADDGLLLPALAAIVGCMLLIVLARRRAAEPT